MKVKLFHPSIVAELYDEDQLEQNLVDKMVYAIRFFREGYSYYTKNVRAIDEEEHKDCIQFLEKLKRVGEDMAIQDGTTLIYKRPDNLELNVNPFYRFLENNDIKKCLTDINTIKSRMMLFLNKDNFVYMHDSYEIMDMWEYVLKQIIEDHE